VRFGLTAGPQLMNHAGAWATLATLGSLAAFTWWLQAATQTPVAANQAVGHVPDYTVADFTLTAMNLAGRPYYRLKAPSMARYADDRTTEVEEPQVEFREQTGPPWEMTADHGWISADRSLVRLLGHVVVLRAGAAGSEPVKLVTSDVSIQPDDRYATTDQPVAAWLGPHRMEARGMKLYLQEGRLQLLSDVRGHYEVGP
jgi:lipopolysaccharide export system protein LptC